jgi:hypothetical protein
MQSLTVVHHENMPGFHYARIMAGACSIEDEQLRRAVMDSARILLERGDR